MLTTFPEKQLSTSPTHSPIHTPKNTINNNKHSTLSSTSPSPKKSKPSIEIVMTDLKPNAPPVLTPPDRKPPSFVQVISNEVAPPPIDSVYLPPHKRYLLNTSLTPAQNSPEYQLRLWTALKGSIISCLNKADATNVPPLVVDLFRENLLWGRGLLCRALMRSESAAPTLAPVLAAIVAVINTKLPQVGELLVRRLVAQFQRAYRRHDKVEFLANFYVNG